MSQFAVEVNQLVKKFPARPWTGDKPVEGDQSPSPKKKRWQFWKKEPKAMFTAVNGVDHPDPARRDLRLARSERRGQIHHDPHVVHAARTHQRHGARQRLRHRQAGERCAAQSGHPVGGRTQHLLETDRAREPRIFCGAVSHPARSGEEARRRADRAHGTQGPRQRTRRKIFDRDAPARRHRQGFACPPAHPSTGRTHARAGPAGCPQLAGTDRAAEAGGTHHPADDALHGGSRSTLRPHRHHRHGQDHRPRHPRRTQAPHRTEGDHPSRGQRLAGMISAKNCWRFKRWRISSHTARRRRTCGK
ncbi:MAG: hypothetical protein MZV64_59570 [Ignavibacteriales bacterium]|nr:hypothetical protein [Ignavibacteriales bacterium]